DALASDHGTMIAGLIAARQTQFQGRGLAPNSLLVFLHNDDAAIGNDLRRAFLRQVRIFNISAHYGAIVPGNLQQYISQYQTALFVVAAGNDVKPGETTKEVCNQFSVFPVCWGDRRNVLVVTATTRDGAQLRQPVTGPPMLPGANWSPKFVHVAAPGEGFHAEGVGS